MASDEGVGYVEGYDCTKIENEPRADSVVFQRRFAELNRKTGQATNLLRDPLAQSTYHNPITKGLLQQVQNLAQTGSSEDLLVAVAGDMAAGMFISAFLIVYCKGADRK